MSFLKRLGINIAKGIAVAAGVWQFAKPSIPENSGVKVFDTILGIGGIIVTTEAIFATINPEGQSGEQKLEAATPLIAQAIMQSELVAGKQVVDQDKFLAGSRKVASGIADILNSLREK